jgi:hypothetical protein
VKEARRTLGSGFTWICDAIDNPIKHALGNAPNSEFVVDGKGRLVRKRAWSDPAALRADLEELVGKVENPTDPADLELAQKAPPRAAARGVVKRIELPGDMRPLVIEPLIEKSRDAPPFYAKLRAEADSALISEGKGQLHIRFMLDPLYHVHWNNLVEPIRVRFVESSGEKPGLDRRVKPGEWTGPEVKEPADVDPREFLATVELGDSREPLKLVVKYFACNDKEGWCRPVTQAYTVQLKGDRDGGRTRSRRGGQRPGGGRGDLAGRPGFGRRPDFGGRPGGFRGRPGGFRGRPGGFGGRRPGGFRGRPGGFGGRPPESSPGPATAAFGRVASINAKRGQLTIEKRGGGTQSVRIDDKTRIERNRQAARLSDLQPGDRIVVKHSSTESGPVTATSILARSR